MKELSWESRKLTKSKKQRDKFYLRQQSKQTKERLDPRVRAEELSLQASLRIAQNGHVLVQIILCTNSEFIPLNNYYLYKGHNLANPLC